MNFFFVLNMNYPFVQISCFCDNLFIYFIDNYVSFEYFKRPP